MLLLSYAHAPFVRTVPLRCHPESCVKSLPLIASDLTVSLNVRTRITWHDPRWPPRQPLSTHTTRLQEQDATQDVTSVPRSSLSPRFRAARFDVASPDAKPPRKA
ncbi:hypothetical protein AAFF_G00150580 [Aldrovandia affinis]|uniref:Uncharacterized protein n=1 Tax=Aldrovandia affinis TaxID=143900 RepID=A0AAD7RPI5_9TELE|nr:hypothetical protein AAFF_G00150580 [Aldrovandia affinis]